MSADERRSREEVTPGNDHSRFLATGSEKRDDRENPTVRGTRPLESRGTRLSLTFRDTGCSLWRERNCTFPNVFTGGSGRRNLRASLVYNRAIFRERSGGGERNNAATLDSPVSDTRRVECFPPTCLFAHILYRQFVARNASFVIHHQRGAAARMDSFE